MISIEKKGRKSGIELLRILAAVFVVILHYNDGRAFLMVNNSANKNLLFFLESISICAVNIFILISGYFLSKNDKRKIDKILILVFQVIIIKLAYYLYALLMHKVSFSFITLFYTLIPNNYFVVLYVTLYLISPYINVLLKQLSNDEYKRMLIILVSIFSVYSIVFDFIPELTGMSLQGISPIGIFGNQQGFNIINFVLLYTIGGYIRRIDINQIPKLKIKSLIIYGISVTVIFLWSLLNEKYKSDSLRSAWCYHNPFVILSAVSLFFLFMQMKISNGIINNLAKSSFMCYLLHPYILNFVKIESFVNKMILVLFVHIIGCAICIYFISYGIDCIYQIFIKIIFQKIKNTEIQYFDNNK